jgi:hypothetical protein
MGHCPYVERCDINIPKIYLKIPPVLQIVAYILIFLEKSCGPNQQQIQSSTTARLKIYYLCPVSRTEIDGTTGESGASSIPYKHLQGAQKFN